MSASAVVESAADLLGPLVQRNVLLRPLTTFRIGGPASLFVCARTTDDLLAVADAVSRTGIDVLVVGQGSNLLVADEGWPGLVVVLDADGFGAISVNGTSVVAGGAVKLPVLARRATAEGVAGLEWMVGVPGSVGGAVRMNAGGHGSDVAANVVAVHVIDVASSLGVERREPTALGLAYRHSSLGPTDIVLDAEFAGTPGNIDAGEELLREIVRWRRANQPGGANCGSVFTNPDGDSAGRMIDAAGLKGFRIGSASVSDKHANFIQADPDASAADVWALIIEVRKRIFDRYGVTLTPEVRTAGFDDTLPALPG